MESRRSADTVHVSFFTDPARQELKRRAPGLASDFIPGFDWGVVPKILVDLQFRVGPVHGISGIGRGIRLPIRTDLWRGVWLPSVRKVRP
jgi:hypothetical protein